jgi:hypothetical protein
MDQYFIGMGGDNSGFNHLTVRNNVATNINPQADNEFSLCYEFFPKLASTELYFHHNYGKQVGWGGVFKIHTTTNSFIHDNVFVRTSNVGNSQSQAVMLGGRVTHPTSETHFHDNTVDDANTSLGAMFIGNTSNNTFVKNNKIKGAGSILWVGGSISDSEITGNTVNNIYSLGATSAISNLLIENNIFEAIDFSAPPSGNIPDVINGLWIIKNIITRSVRFQATTSSDDLQVHNNEFQNVTALSILACDNISFKYNNIVLDDTWAAGSQFANITGAWTGYKQMNNTWDMKGLASQTTWINGAVSAQIVGETAEDPRTRLILDNGVATEVFDNRLKLNGGSWAAA